MATTFPSVRKIQDGTNVSESVTNKPVLDLEKRTDYLKNQVDNVVFLSNRLFIPQQDIDDACLDSYSVYLDQATNKWKPARVFAEGIEDSTKVELQQPSFTQGIVKNITGAAGSRKGDIYIFGLINAVVAANMLEGGGSPTVGIPYYLSINEEGKITDTAPLIGEVFMGKFTNLTDFLLTPSIDLGTKSNLAHEHVWFTLDNSRFSSHGTHSPGGEPQWLYPAAEFPTFPPIPYNSAVLLVNGTEYHYGTSYEITDEGLIYWSDTYTPVDPYIIYKLYYTKFSTAASGIVSSLCAGTDNVAILDVNTGDDATNGELVIKVIPTFAETGNQGGSTVVKALTADSQTGAINVLKGSVVERVKSGSGISVDNEQGIVTVSNAQLVREGVEINDIILLNVKEKIWPNSTLSYLEYTYGVDARLVAKFLVDSEVIKDTEIRMGYFGNQDSSGESVLFITYRIHKSNDAPGAPGTTVQKTLQVTKDIQWATILTISKDVLEKNAIVSFDIKRFSNDTYLGNLGQLYLKRVEI